MSSTILHPTQTTEELVQQLRRLAAGTGAGARQGLVHEERQAARPPAYAVLRPLLPPALSTALRARGVSRLYTHQVAAITAARHGQDVVITTPTASGKTYCFNLPIIERALLEPEARALYLYPTKALMADQMRGLDGLLGELGSPVPVRAGLLDGDVAGEDRDRMRAAPPHILIANPDIVHYELLARHGRWRQVLAGLRFIVLDELHAYRGAFGAHVSLILRRLLRLAARYGAHPAIIAASATIANPGDLAESLAGRQFQVITGDGAGAHRRRFLFWQPREQQRRARASETQEAVALFVELLRAGRTAILFGRSRMSVESMAAAARDELEPHLAERISAYKSGYTAEERRQIESGLRQGHLRGVVATNALELGIDIGSLDAAVLAGYPGSVMSTWQQAGRVGRREGDEALIILVGGSDALDQYYINHPRAFFGQPSEHAVADPSNRTILLAHLLCAAREAPLQPEELAFFPENAPEMVALLEREQLLSSGPPWRPTTTEHLHSQVRMRGGNREQYQIVHGERVVATSEPPLLYREAHPGAVYLHQGRAYRVKEIDVAARRVRVEPAEARVRTSPVIAVSVDPNRQPLQWKNLRLGPATAEARVGFLAVREEIAAYREKAGRAQVQKPIEPPLSHDLETMGCWLDLPEVLGAGLPALHAAEHALMNALPIALLCDRRDLGSTADPGATPGGRIYLFDRYEGGVGLAEKAYHLLDDLVARAVELLQGCPCEHGCPACLHLAGCARGNEDLDKTGALALLQGIPQAARRVAEGRSAVSRARRGGSLGQRLQRIAEHSLEEEAATRPPLQAGEEMDYVGVGKVVVLQPGVEMAYVQLSGSQAKAWVAIGRLRRLD